MSLNHISPKALRDYVQFHHENAYVLVDVRQPEEYSQSHIPGARLMPLPQLARDMEQLPTDKELVFYCRSGGRSMAAAAMLEEEGFNGPIYNLTGGMLAWDGGRVADTPQIDLFAGQTPIEMFKTAMNLEKGAQIFYDTVGRENADHPWAQIFAQLAKAELSHARTVYGFWQKAESRSERFESVFDQFSGEVLEGGMSLKRALEKLAATHQNPCMRLIETALQIEYAAFDLYRTLADQLEPQESRQAFIQLAQAEKAHMRILIDAIVKCGGE